MILRHPEEIARRGEWLLRGIVSLLAMPGADHDQERALIEEFVVPVLVPQEVG